MKGAIASVDFFVDAASGAPRRLTLTIAAPERAAGGPGWTCRLALADLHRPQAVDGRDSVEALARAVDQARAWLAALHAQGRTLTRDRAGETPFEPL